VKLSSTLKYIILSFPSIYLWGGYSLFHLPSDLKARDYLICAVVDQGEFHRQWNLKQTFGAVVVCNRLYSASADLWLTPVLASVNPELIKPVKSSVTFFVCLTTLLKQHKLRGRNSK
jgi:hypothetical protein